ncbi:MAG: cation diffusion facilitator family transporter [Candidatus Omnitrophota bacterium]|nr:cation diffusion facilitator family transporter [Candidatus Omnitrophota bacterium]
MRPLVGALLITAAVMVLEIVVGLLSHSLALLADAGHMATDAAALGMSLFACWIARQPATRTKTYGFYRTEILAAFLNGLTLWLIVAWIVYEATRRFFHPPVVQAPMMLVTAVIGLSANLGCAWLLRPSQAQSLNLRGAYLHVLLDAVGSVSVIGAAVVIWTTGWFRADSIASLLVCAGILWGSWNLIRDSVNILLEGAPAHIEVTKVMRAMQAVPGVRRVHDTHIWTITSGMEAMSAHVVVDSSIMNQEVLDCLNKLLCDRFGIHHTTFQLETT